MNKEVNENINKAFKYCKKLYIDDDSHFKGFNKIYPFTTENIAGYIDNFELSNKSLLTVGSSGDQIINACLKGCNNVTVLDVNPFAKYYYYLKISSILCLNVNEFWTFLRYINYPTNQTNNEKVFDQILYSKVKTKLKELDYESFIFWDELFNSIDKTDIRENLFSNDEETTNVISNCNLYLKNQKSYYTSRKILESIRPKFINCDVFKAELNNTYDNIWLSNISSYLTREQTKLMVDKTSNYLNNNGKILICYLYKTYIGMKYEYNWSPIYNLEKTFDILKEYNPEFISFSGIDELEYNNSTKDGILIYKKTK